MLFYICRLKIEKTRTIGTKCYNTSGIPYLIHNYSNKFDLCNTLF